MPYRYAVLWETCSDQGTRPVGLAIEQDGYVLVETRDDLCIPTRYEDPITVGGLGLHPTVYKPSDERYFDQVLLDLSRPFIIGAQNVVMHASEGVVLRLLVENVLRPLRREHVGVYTSDARKYPALKQYHAKHYTSSVATTDDDYDEPVAAHEAWPVVV